MFTNLALPYGLSLVLLSWVAMQRRDRSAAALPWSCLALFALLAGLASWTTAWLGNHWLVGRVTAAGLTAGAGVALLEFARRAQNALGIAFQANHAARPTDGRPVSQAERSNQRDTTSLNTKSPAISKPWGIAQVLYGDQYVELWRLAICQGGYSSRHKHRFKSNGFLVADGRLLVITYEGQQQVRKMLGGSDGVYFVPAGVEHRFLAVEDATTVYELYHAAPGCTLRRPDIQRRDDNGVFIGNVDEFPG